MDEMFCCWAGDIQTCVCSCVCVCPKQSVLGVCKWLNICGIVKLCSLSNEGGERESNTFFHFCGLLWGHFHFWQVSKKTFHFPICFCCSCSDLRSFCGVFSLKRWKLSGAVCQCCWHFFYPIICKKEMSEWKKIFTLSYACFSRCSQSLTYLWW